MDNDGHQPENVPGKFCPCGLQIFRSSPLTHAGSLGEGRRCLSANDLPLPR
jgi:hypothetical protein